MSDKIPVVEAFRVMAANKSLSESELHDLIREGIHAALARRFGGPVEAEIDITEDGDIEIVVLKEVVEEVEDPARQISLEEARWDDPDFQVGDLMEIPVAFEDFGRNAVMAAKQRIIQSVREGEREKIREEFSDKLGELVSGEVQQVQRGKIVVMLNRAPEAEAIIPWREQNPRERFRQGEPIRAVLKKVEETPRGPKLILSRGDPAFVANLFAIEVPEIYQGIVEIREIVREAGGARRSPFRHGTSPSTRSGRAWASRAPASRRSCPSSAASASTSCPGTPTRRSSRAGRWLRPRSPR